MFQSIAANTWSTTTQHCQGAGLANWGTRILFMFVLHSVNMPIAGARALLSCYFVILCLKGYVGMGVLHDQGAKFEYPRHSVFFLLGWRSSMSSRCSTHNPNCSDSWGTLGELDVCSSPATGMPAHCPAWPVTAVFHFALSARRAACTRPAVP